MTPERTYTYTYDELEELLRACKALRSQVRALTYVRPDGQINNAALTQAGIAKSEQRQ